MKYGELEVITEGYPKEMLCWDIDENIAKPRLVMYEVVGINYPYKILSQSGDIISYKYAKDIINSKPRTIKDGLKYGDIIVRDSALIKILGTCGEVIFISYVGNHSAVNSYYTLKELIEKGWELQQSKPTQEIVELTIEEVAKLKGVDPSLIRIKE